MPLILKASAQNLVHPTLSSPHPLHQRSVCKLSGILATLGDLSDIVEVIVQSWRDSTCKQYKVYINKWLQFCEEEPHDPLHPSVRSLLSFLHSLFVTSIVVEQDSFQTEHRIAGNSNKLVYFRKLTLQVYSS